MVLSHLNPAIATKEGKVFPVEITANFLEYNGKEYHCSFARDITERKQVQEALRESEENFQALAENANDGILIAMGEEGWHVYANRRAVEITGYPIEELLKTRIRDLAYPDELPKLTERYKKRLTGLEVPKPYETALVNKDGIKVPIEISPSKTTWQNQPAEMVIFRDITERKQAENELRKFKTISDKAGYGVSIVDLEGNVIYNNTAYGRMHGYTPGELIGKHLSIFHTEQQMANVNRLIEQLNREGSYVAEEVWHKRNDNTEFPILMNGTLVKDENGTPLFMAATAIDITERKQAEEALRESEEKYRALIEAAGRAGEGIIIIQDSEEQEGAFVFVNDQFCRMSGYSREELLGRSAWDLVPHEISVRLKDWYKRRHMGESLPTYYEAAGVRKDGAIVPLELSIVTMPWQGKTATALYLRDITERKRAEILLRQSLDQIDLLLNASSYVLYYCEAFGDFDTTYISGNIEPILGYKPDEFLQKGFWVSKIHPEDAPRILTELYQLFEHGFHKHGYRFQHKNGSWRWMYDELRLNRDEQGNPKDIVGSMVDITERKRAGETLRESEERWKSLTENSPDHIMLLDLDGTILFINRTVPDLTKEEVIGASNLKYVPPEYHQITIDCYKRVLASGRSDMYTTVYHTKEGEVRYFDVRVGPVFKDGQVVAFISSSTDITERKRVEEALKESENRSSRSIIESSKDGIIFFDGKTHKDSFSQTVPWLILLGCSKADLAGRSDSKSRISLIRVVKHCLQQEFQRHVRGEISISSAFPVLPDDEFVF